MDTRMAQGDKIRMIKRRINIKMNRKQNQIDKMPYSITIPPRQKYTIEYQEAVLNKYEGDNTIYSSRPFRIKLANGQKLASGLDIREPLIKVIVWKDRHGAGIRSDGSTTYKLPEHRLKQLLSEGKIYYDLTNQEYAVDDREIY